MLTPDDVALAQLRERLAQAGADGVRLAEFDRIAPTVQRDDAESTQAWSLRALATVAAADGNAPTLRDELAAAAQLIAAAHTKLTAAAPPGSTQLAEAVSLVRSYLGMSLAHLRDIERSALSRP